jgi:predicted PurR-regulated permease PerM
MNIPPPSPRQTRILWAGVTTLAIAVIGGFIFGALLGFGWLVDRLSPVIFPLAIAGVIAYLLDPLVDFFERRGVSRTRSIILVFFIGVMLVAGLLATVVPRIVVETGDLVRRAPGYVKTLQGKAEASPYYKKLETVWHAPVVATNTVGTVGTTTNTPPTTVAALTQEMTQKALEWAGTILPEVGSWVLDKAKRAASLLGWVLGLALVPVYAFYFLMEKKGIQTTWTDYLPIRESQAKEEVIFVLTSVNDSLIVFFRGQVLVAMCSGAMLTVAFLSLGLNYALLLGAMAGMLGIIPYLGVTISLIPAVALAAVQFGDWRVFLIPAIFAVVNAIEGFVISPKIIGDRVGLHPLTIIVALVVGTTLLGGVLGGVLAIPLTAALRAIMFRYVWRKKHLESTPADPESKPPADPTPLTLPGGQA